jgi:hypothetical protein
MNSDDLKKHMQPHFEIFEGLDIYFWIAGGAIKDFFIGKKPKDYDFFFTSHEDRKAAQKRLLEIGAKKFKDLPRGEKYIYKNNYYDMLCWSGSGESLANAKTPEEMIKLFDFTVGMAALDSRKEFVYHVDFEDHIKTKTLVRNSIRDRQPRINNKRLLKYIRDGFTIDQENLLLWLEDQEATFKHRKQINKK